MAERVGRKLLLRGRIGTYAPDKGAATWSLPFSQQPGDVAAGRTVP